MTVPHSLIFNKNLCQEILQPDAPEYAHIRAIRANCDDTWDVDIGGERMARRSFRDFAPTAEVIDSNWRVLTITVSNLEEMIALKLGLPTV